MPIPHRIRTVTRWLPFSSQRRNKQMWHINKSNAGTLILQFCGFLKIVKEKDLENRNWRSIKDIIKREMSVRGLSAPRISDSRIGTLKSDIYQMGFIQYKETGLIITKAGKFFLNNPREALLKQYIKLQFTNPPIYRFCKNIYVFPVLGLIKLLLKLNYLTKEEIGYIVFTKFLYEDDLENVIEKIQEFRIKQPKERKEILTKFKNTPEGHVALKAASTAGYLCSRLNLTDIFEYNTPKILKLKKNKLKKIHLLVKKYQNISPYPYKKTKLDHKIWFEYFGNPDIEYPPQIKKISFNSSSVQEVIVRISRNDENEASYNTKTNKILFHPFFNECRYNVEIYNGVSNTTSAIIISPKFNKDVILDLEQSQIKTIKLDANYYKDKILELINSSDYDQELKNKLSYLRYVFELTNFNQSSIRGARLEELFKKLLDELKNDLKIKKIIWKGRIDEYGIPHPTPGGIQGNPDIVFIIDNKIILLELTTIRSRSGQENAESFNIVRHARNFESNNKDLYKKYKIKESLIVFSAPILHKDLCRSLENIFIADNIKHSFIPIEDLLNVFLKNKVESIFS